MMDQLLADLRSDEGFRAHVYQDNRPEKYWTLGYGFLVDSRRGGGIPRPVAEFWLRYLVNERMDELRKRWPHFDKQPEHVQRALMNMAYQLGVSGLLGFKKMLAALALGNTEEAVAHALDSAWAKQTPSRAIRVAELIRGYDE